MRDGTLIPPFPWFGAKTLVAPLVWQAIGDVRIYIEPFAGSLAVLLARPAWHTPNMEIVNDADCLIINFWRGIKLDPEAIAEYADWPVSEADMEARRKVIRSVLPTLCDKIKADPEYFDARLAGWWVWGISGSLGGRFAFNLHRNEVITAKTATHLGINRLTIGDLRAHFARLSERMRRVVITCGDWKRAVTDPILKRSRDVGIFLDPPYNAKLRSDGIYTVDDSPSISDEVREWAIDVGADPRIKIVLAGLEPEHAGKIPDSWTMLRWRARGGPVFNHAEVTNRHLERLWLSPGCRLRAKELF